MTPAYCSHEPIAGLSSRQTPCTACASRLDTFYSERTEGDAGDTAACISNNTNETAEALWKTSFEILAAADGAISAGDKLTAAAGAVEELRREGADHGTERNPYLEPRGLLRRP